MPERILITSTSFLHTPGAHLHDLARAGYDQVEAWGPLREHQLIELLRTRGPFVGVLCGEDDYGATVLEAMAPHTKVISKYGVGLDRINLDVAERLGIRVCNTPGSNHHSVAELTFGLLLSLSRKIPEHNRTMHAAEWRRMTGVELLGKTIGVLGLGRVGRSVALRALSFGMHVLAFNSSWSRSHQAFEESLGPLLNAELDAPRSFRRARSVEELLQESDVISLHTNITKDTARMLNERTLELCKRNVLILNPSRAGLVDQAVLASMLSSGRIAGYAADVVDPEPVEASNPLLGLPNVILTPHVGSRTTEAVQRQGQLAVANLLNVLREEPLPPVVAD